MSILEHFAILVTCLTIGTFSIVKQEDLMTQEKMSPLRERMIEDMRIHGMGDKA